ncbi:FAD-binding domain-containing protein [Ceratobasidium sp. AG-I]|nr:FAD-binding domain-containing protein [Ceratobasidium sp. AG-I]
MLLPIVSGLALLGTTAAISPFAIPQAQWDALNSTVGGRLGRGVPFARACFSQAGVNVTSGGADCASVQTKYGLDTFRAGQFGATMKSQWEMCQKTNEGCLLDPVNPKNASAFTPPKVCNQGSISPYYIAVKTAADVTQGFAFSKRTGVPLLIKNSGHDFAGRSSAPGTLALWVHNIKYINYSTTFVAEKCAVQGIPAVTYGAGQDLESLYLFAEANNITFVGGTARTVAAAGGWVQGGGHSVLSNVYGLGVDRVLQFRVVTPDGQLRVANACQNQDLFWALRGGGGGTFGVVMEATSEIIPHRVSTAVRWTLNPTPENVLKLMTVVVQNSLQWAKDGWGGYIYPTSSIMANPKLNATTAAASLKPLTDFLKVATDGAGGSPGSGAQSQMAQYASYLPLFSSILTSPVSSGTLTALSSRLIPETLFTPTSAPALLNATLQMLSLCGGQSAIYLNTPYSYSAAPNQTSVSPAWRGALWHILSQAEWEWDAGVDAAKTAYVKVNAAMNPLRALTPGGGAYQNEADVYEPGASSSFWGSNYPQLYAIKQKYDPSGLLDCWHCVGWKGKATPIASCYF